MSKLEDLIQQYCPDGVEYKSLNEICFAAANIKWKNTSEQYEYIDLTSVDIDTHAIVATSKIDSETAPSRAQQIVKQGDVIFATTRPTQMRVCVIPPKYDGAICSTGYCVLRPDTTKVLSSFLFFILSIEDFKRYLEQKQTMGNYPAISNKLLKEYVIPIPSLTEQQRIVEVLDRFDTLTNDITAGLPAEIEARRKQYEYYRDQLLTFKKKA
jgi:type I restriction enzyme S subunit